MERLNNGLIIIKREQPHALRAGANGDMHGLNAPAKKHVQYGDDKKE